MIRPGDLVKIIYHNIMVKHNDMHSFMENDNVGLVVSVSTNHHTHTIVMLVNGSLCSTLELAFLKTLNES